MITVLGRTPPSDYIKHQPYTLEEIDTHSDSKRLWATLVSIAQEYERLIDDSYDYGFKDGEVYGD